ncbi:LamG-like jellyroll fold domain-containing protein [Marinoscillum sp.]|uniref:LamG-like jellyroll fold domain-containing protein n=1 Tax=Marinoscillum sp. TaxID=2024838 RepID=UPI003BABBC4E
MRRILLVIAILFIGILGNAQTFENFETESDAATSFTSNGKTFNLTNAEIENIASAGVNGSDFFIDNNSDCGTATTASFATNDGSDIYVQGIWVFSSTSCTGSPSNTAEPATITALENSASQFTITIDDTGGDVTWTNISNAGFTYVDFVALGHGEVAIDEISIDFSGGSIDYIAFDDFRWSDRPISTYNIEDFEGQTDGVSVFTINGQSFTTTNSLQVVDDGGSNYGVNNTPKYLDNSAASPSIIADGATPYSASITTTGGEDIYVNELYVFLSNDGGSSTTFSESVNIIGRESGGDVFTQSVTATLDNENNGFSRVTLSDANQLILVDEILISPQNTTAGNEINYIAIDNFKWTVPCSEPTSQATVAVFGAETSTTLDLTSWTAPVGGASGYAVFINDVNTFTPPTNGDEPTADLSWNSAGQQPVYFGTSAAPSITITGLAPSTTYYFSIYSYNDCAGFETYETTGLNSSDITGNAIPVFANLNGNPTFIEDGTAVVLDADVAISDVELDAADDYTDAVLTISRNGGANANDDFDFVAGNNLALNGTDIELSSNVIATFIESGGTLTVTFTGTGATPVASDVDLVLQQINYSNTNNNPPASVTLDWTFSDGDGGSTSGTNQTVVDITSTNDAPVFTIGSNITLAEDAAGVQTYTGFVTGIDDGDGTSQILTFNVSDDNNALFSAGPAINASGDLTFTLAGSTWGQATVTVSLTDDGTPNETSADQEFEIFVTPTGIVINEIDAVPGAATEFVEIYDGGAGSTSLSGLVLVIINGADDLIDFNFNVTGSTTAGGYYVIGDAGTTNLDQDWGSAGLQDGPDAVALYVGDDADFVNDVLPNTDGLVDFILYDTDDADDAGLLGIFGGTQYNENANGNASTESLARVPDGASTFTARTPTPGAANSSAPTANDFNKFTSISYPVTFLVADFGYSDSEGDPFTSIEVGSVDVTDGALFLDDGALSNNGIQEGDEPSITGGETITVAEIPDLTYIGATGTDIESFDFTVNDGFENSGTYTSTLNTVENALDFDDTDDFVSVAGGTNLAFSTTDAFTVEGWVNGVSDAGNSFIYNGLGTNFLRILYLANGQLSVDLNGSGSGAGFIRKSASTLNPVTDGNWHHFAITYDGSETLAGLAIYVDGVLESTYTNELNTLSSSFSVGQGVNLGASGGTNNFNGTFDELRVWSEQITSSQIRANAASRLSNPSGEVNLELYYDFNNGIASGDNTGIVTLFDRSSNGYNGTLNNFDVSGGTGTSNWVSSDAFNAAEPEIRVTDGSTNEITDGGAFTFGAFNVRDGATESETFTIHNDGLADLTISGSGDIAVSNTAFTVDQTGLTFPLVLTPGTSATFDIDWTAAAETVVSESETLTINSDDADEAVFDYSVTGYVVENALDFDGSNDYILIGDQSNLDFDIGDPLTIEAWVKPEGGTERTIFRKNDAGIVGYFFNINGSNQLQFGFSATTGMYVVTSSALTNGEWYHVVARYDGTNNINGMSLFINGQEDTTPGANTTLSGTSVNTGDALIGTRHDFSGSYFNGMIDELRVWRMVRDSSQIRASAASRLSTPSGIVNLELYYDFNQGIPSGTNTGLDSLIDLSSNGYNADLTGTFALTGATTNWVASDAFTSTAATTPSIAIYDENDNLISNGGTFTFESIGYGTSTDTTFAIHNEGLGDLDLDANPILTQDTTYSLVTPYSSTVTVGPGSTQDLTVSFAPYSNTNYTDVLTIGSTDAGGDYIINLDGDGLDLTAPSYETGFPAVTTITPTSFDIEVQLDEPGFYNYIVTTSATPPATKAEIDAGTGSAGITNDNGQVDVVAGTTTYTITVSGATALTSYYVHYYAEDKATSPNETAIEGPISVITAGDNSTLAAVGSSEAGFFNSGSYNAAGTGSTFTNANSIEVFQFTVTDETGDNLPTIIDDFDITITSTDPTEVRAIGLSIDGGTSFIAETPVTTATETVTISGGLSVADNTAATVSVFVSFDASPTEEQYQFAVSSYSQPADGTTVLASSTPTSSIGGDENTVDNTAPKVADIEFFDADHDGLTERVDITFSELVDVADASMDLADFGYVILPSNDTIQTVSGLSFTPSSGFTTSVSIQGISDQAFPSTGTVNVRIEEIANLWEDQAGNLIVDDVTETVTDSAVPIITSTSPANGSISFPNDDDFVIVFSEQIQYETGIIDVNNLTTVTDFDEYDVSGPAPEFSLTNDSVLTITHTLLTLTNEYEIVIPAGAFAEKGNAAFTVSGQTITFTSNDIQPDDCTFNYRTYDESSGYSYEGKLAPSDCNPMASTAASTLDQETEAFTALTFNILEGSTSSQGKRTEIVDVTILNDNSVLWSEIIAGAYLIDQDGNKANVDQINDGSLVFEDIDDEPGDIDIIAINSDKEYALKVWFKNNIDPSIAASIDNSTLTFKVGKNEFTGSAGDQDVSRVYDPNTGEYENDNNVYVSNSVTLTVLGTHYGFALQPSETEARQVMSAVSVQAEDENGNRDVDYSESQTLTITNAGPLEGTPQTSGTFNSGVSNVVDNIVFSNPVTAATLGTSGGDLDNSPVSDAFNITCDVTAPTISPSAISITTTGSGQSGTFAIGDVVTAQYDNKVDKNPDLRNITFDFTEFGGSTHVISAPTNGTDSIYETSYAIVAGSIEASNLNVKVSGTDDAADYSDYLGACTDNTSSQVDGTDDVSVDNQRPTLSSYDYNPSPSVADTDIETTADLLLTFSEDVTTSFGVINVVDITNGTQTQTFNANNTSYVTISSTDVTINTPNAFTGSNDYEVLIDGNSFTDVHGNAYLGLSSPSPWAFSTATDAQAPELTINVLVTNGDETTTKDQTITFQFVWNEPVFNFDKNDLSLNSSGFVNGALTGSFSQTGTQTYELTVGNLVTDGVSNGSVSVTIQDNIALSPIQDGAGTPNTYFTTPGVDSFTSAAVTIDQAAPAVTINQLYTKDDTPPITGTVDENVSVSVQVTNTAFGYNYSGTASITGGAFDWEIADNTLTPITSEGTYTVIATATDAAGNVASVNSNLVYDITPPEIQYVYYYDDSPQNGTIDRIIIYCTENIQNNVALPGNIDPTEFVIDGGSGSGTLSTVFPRYFYLTVTGVSGTAPFDVEYDPGLGAGLGILDLAGNEMVAQSSITQIDVAYPTVQAAYMYDTDNDGNLDEVVVEFTEPVFYPATADPHLAFQVDGGDPDGMLTHTLANNDLDQLSSDQYLTLDVSITGTGLVEVTFDPSINGTIIEDVTRRNDAFGNSLITEYDNAEPVVINAVSNPAAGTVRKGQSVDITLTFSESVTTSGSERLYLDLGGSQFATTVGANSVNQVFNYLVADGDESSDLDYIVTDPLQLNGGSIVDGSGNNAILTLDAPGTGQSISANGDLAVDGVVPTFVIAEQYDYANNGTIDEIVIEFSEPVDFSTFEAEDFILGGTFTVDGLLDHTSVNVSNPDASATDEYITLGVTGTNSASVSIDYNPTIIGASLSSSPGSDLNGNLIENGGAWPISVTASDEARPRVLSVTGANGTYGIGNTVSLYAKFSENIKVNGTGLVPTLRLETGTFDQIVEMADSRYDTIIFDYTIQEGDVSPDLDYNSNTTSALLSNERTINDTTGNSNTAVTALPSIGASSLSGLRDIVIDGVRPTFVSADEHDTDGDGTIDQVLIKMSESVNDAIVDFNDFDLGSGVTPTGIVSASGLSSSVADTDGSSTDEFITLAVTSTSSGTATFTLGYNGVSVQDLAGNVANSNSSISVNDFADPIILSVTSSISDGAYNQGDVIPVQVTFSEVVSYTTGGTPPAIALNTGATTVSQDAVLASGNGTKILVFNYTVQANDASSDLNYVDDDALSLNTGSITDQASRSIATTNELAYATTNSQSLADLKDIVIDTEAPGITSLTIVSNNANNTGLAKGDDPNATGDGEDQVTITMDFNDELIAAPTVQVRSSGSFVSNTPTIIADDIAQGQYRAVFDVDRNDADGRVSFTIDYSDKAGNTGVQLDTTDITGGGSTITIDNTNPTVDFSISGGYDPISQNPFTVIASFDETITGLGAGDFISSNGTVGAIAGSSSPYTFTVSPTAGQTSTISIQMIDEGVTDEAGNTILNTTFDVVFDDQAPSITYDFEVTGQDLDISLTQDEIGVIYYALVPDGLTASSSEVKGGSVSGAITQGNRTYNAANVSQDFTLSLPDPRTDYDLLLVAEDAVDPTPFNLSSVVRIDVKSGGVVISDGAPLSTNPPSITGLCLEGDYFPLDPIVISETIETDFSSSTADSRTLTLALPDLGNDGVRDFEFRESLGSVSTTGGDISAISIQVNVTSLVLTYTCSTESNLDEITISDLEIRALGSTVSDTTLLRTGGSGDFYLANADDGSIFATFETVAPYDGADVLSSDPSIGYTNPYLYEWSSGILEDGLGDGVTVFDYNEVNTTDTVFVVGLPKLGDSVNVYSDANLTTSIFGFKAENDEDSIYLTLDDLGLTQSNVGVNTFYVTTFNGNSCESAEVKFSAAIVRFENSAGKTGFSLSDGTGTTLKFSLPTDHSRLFTGNGLAGYQIDNDFTSPAQEGTSVRFIPSAVGATGTEIVTYELTNTSTQVTATYGIEFLVIESDKVLSTSSNQPVDYCQYDYVDGDNGTISLNMVSPIGIDYLGDPDGDEASKPNFKTVRVYLYDTENETRGAEVTNDVFTSIPASIPNDTAGWLFNTAGVDSYLTATTYSQPLLFVYVISEDGDDSQETELSQQIITIYRQPTVTITNMNDYYCNDDGDFDITSQVISAVGTETLTISEYTIYKSTDGGTTYAAYGANSGVRTGANFDPADPDDNGTAYPDEEEFGLYRIEYTSPDRTNAGCNTTITFDFEILEIPDLPALDESNFAGHSDGDDPNDSPDAGYLIEYSAGEVVEDLTIDLSSYGTDVRVNWYNAANRTSPIPSSHISGTYDEELNLATAFFGGNTQPTGRQNVTFYYTITDNIDVDGGGYAGCESEAKTISLQVYPIPGQPVAESLVSSTTTNTSNSKNVSGEYFYEYCVDDGTIATLSTVDLDETLNTEDATESYFILYDEDTVEVDRFQGAETLTDSYIKTNLSYSAADSTSLVFFVSQKNFDNNYPTDNGAEFGGCEGDLRKFTIDVNAIPDMPESSDFNGYDNNGVVEYYLCSGDNLENILTPQIEGAKYNWYQDNNGSPSSTLINVAAFNDNFVRQSELVAAGFTNTVTSDTTFTYWVTQTVEANTASGFKGCESEALQVNITVYPDPETPTVSDLGSSGLVEVSGEYRASFCVGSVDFSYQLDGLSASENNNETVRFNVYSVTSTGQLSTTPVYSDTTSTGQLEIIDSDLRMTSQIAGTYTFKISQVNTTVGGVTNDAIFTGCETEEDDMAVLVLYLYDVPDAPVLADDPTGGSDDRIYYNVGDQIADFSVTGDDQSNNIYRWYNADTNDLLVADTTASGTSTVSAADLGVSAAGVYNFTVDQTSDFGEGVDAFDGCTGSSTAFTVTIFELPPAPNVTDPASQCNTDLTPTSTKVSYSGVTTSDNSQTRFYFYDANGSEITNQLSQNPDITSEYTVEGIDAAYGNTTEYINTTISIQQVTNIIPGEFDGGSASELSEVNIVIAPIPRIGTYTVDGLINPFRIVEACDNALVTLDLKLNNVLIDSATFEWTAGPNQNTDVEITPVGMTKLGDYEARFEFDPIESNLGFGDRFFQVLVTDDRRPDDLDTEACIAVANMTFEIGTSPIPKLRWEGITEGKETTLVLGDDNTSLSENYWVDSIYVEIPAINFTRGRLFGKPASPGAVIRDNLWTISEVIFNNSGLYDVNVTYFSGSACIGELTRTITVLDHFVVTDEIGFSFEGSDPGDWFVEYANGFADRSMAWELGSSDFNAEESSSGNYWVTGNNSAYAPDANSWVYSPSFDLSGMTNPTVGFDQARDLNFTDGVVFQYSLDDGRSWAPLGSFEDGLGSGKNWYNTEEISGSPGDEAQGYNPQAEAWTRQNKWERSAHRINGLYDQIRFRFALGSTGGTKEAADGSPQDGFAFDEFSIYNKNKFILVEQFSNFGANSVSQTNQVVELVDSTLSTDAIILNYYLGEDGIVGRSNSGADARSSYYGVDEVPQSVLTGINVNNVTALKDLSLPFGWNANYYNSIALDQAVFEIEDMTFGDDPTRIDISTSFTYSSEGLELPEGTELSFRFAIVEKEITDPELMAQNGDQPLRNVLRKMLPNTGGFTYKGKVSPNQNVFINGSAEVTTGWNISDIYNPEQLMVIAFVQVDYLPDSYTGNTLTNKLILQAKAMDVPGKTDPEVTGVTRIPNISQFEIYPNPANKSFKVQLEVAPKDDMSWVVYDQVGRKVMIGAVKPGELEIEVDSRDLPSGVYMIHFFNSEERWQPKRIVVVH